MEDLSQALCVHCLARMGGVKRVGKINQGLTETNVTDFSVLSFIIRMVEEYLQVFLQNNHNNITLKVIGWYKASQ